MLGQHLFAGFEGTRVTDAFARQVREAKIGNVILFSHNVGSAGDLRRLCAELQDLFREATGFPAFIAVDQEGGTVSRLGKDFAVVPGAMALAATGDPQNAYDAGLITGRELRATGINFDLAPVADVNSNPLNPVIGVRSYGEDPGNVARFACEMMRGLRDGGVLSCAKHFPGHGDTDVDSHVGLPLVDKPLEALLETELVPFQALIDAGVPAVMSTHILFPRLAPERVPATMSRKIMTGLLKERMGFRGLVLSDCMMMGAIADHFGSAEGIVQAIRAGVDLVFASHSAALAAEASRRLLSELREGRIDAAELRASTELILKCKSALPPPGEADPGCVGCAEHRRRVLELYGQSLTAVRLPPGGLPMPGARPLFIGCLPAIPSRVSSPVSAQVPFHEALQKRFGGDAFPMSEDPGAEEIARAAAQAPGHSCVVAGTCNAYLKTGQAGMVRALAASGAPVVCVALRGPYDLAALPPNVCGIAAYAYNDSTLDAVAKLLAGEIRAAGVLPVRLKG